MMIIDDDDDIRVFVFCVRVISVRVLHFVGTFVCCW